MTRDSSRRQFLRQSSLIAMAPVIPAFLRSTARASAKDNDERILVVVQLDGGNDGLNTIVPFANEAYSQHRKELQLKADRLVKISDDVGFHRSLRPMADLLDDRQFAVVQGVGYPNPNRSHDVSMAIWQTARFDRDDHKSFGWLGRAMDERRDANESGAADSVLLGTETPPVALRGRRSKSVSLAHLGDLKLRAELTPNHRNAAANHDLLAFARRASLDARASADLIDEVAESAAREPSSYPDSQLASRLSSIAQLIKSGFSTRVYYAIQSGYDTHAAQLPTHSRLLNELAGALKAFQDDLNSAGLADRVLTLCFSEFGRRVKENASLGTDHGTAGPIMVMGSKVNDGLIGTVPDMTDLKNGDLKMQFDFRQVYASLLRDWLTIPVEPILNGPFPGIQLVATG